MLWRNHLAVFVGLSLLLMAAPGLTRGQEESEDVDINELPRISVSGTGTISAAPDLGDINVGVVTQAPTARDALTANTEAMSRLLAVVKEQGVAAKDVQTTNVNVNPQYSQPPPQRTTQGEFVPRIVAYQVTNTVHLKVRELTKLGAILDAVVSAGANQVYGISFQIDEPEKLLDQARKQAMADAKRKAELLTGEAGMVLGPPLLISETGGQPTPMMPRLGRMMAMAEAAPVPVAAGEQELSVTVQVQYELRQAK